MIKYVGLTAGLSLALCSSAYCQDYNAAIEELDKNFLLFQNRVEEINQHCNTKSASSSMENAPTLEHIYEDDPCSSIDSGDLRDDIAGVSRSIFILKSSNYSENPDYIISIQHQSAALKTALESDNFKYSVNIFSDIEDDLGIKSDQAKYDFESARSASKIYNKNNGVDFRLFGKKGRKSGNRITIRPITAPQTNINLIQNSSKTEFHFTKFNFFPRLKIFQSLSNLTINTNSLKSLLGAQLSNSIMIFISSIWPWDNDSDSDNYGNEQIPDGSARAIFVTKKNGQIVGGYTVYISGIRYTGTPPEHTLPTLTSPAVGIYSVGKYKLSVRTPNNKIIYYESCDIDALNPRREKKIEISIPNI